MQHILHTRRDKGALKDVSDQPTAILQVRNIADWPTTILPSMQDITDWPTAVMPKI